MLLLSVLEPMYKSSDKERHTPMKTKVCWIAVLAVCLATLSAQELLTNETILKLVKAGIGEDTIVGMVNQQPGRYALSADDLVALKTAGVSDKVLAAMIVRNGATAAPAACRPLRPSLVRWCKFQISPYSKHRWSCTMPRQLDCA
jgi:hypothetical protein